MVAQRECVIMTTRATVRFGCGWGFFASLGVSAGLAVLPMLAPPVRLRVGVLPGPPPDTCVVIARV